MAVAEHLSNLYSAQCSWEPSTASDQPLLVDLATIRIGELSLTRASLTGYRLTRTSSDSFQVVLPLKGVVCKSVKSRDEMCVMPSHGLLVTRQHETTTYSVPDGVGLILYLPARALAERAEVLTGDVFEARDIEAAASHMAAEVPAAEALAHNLKAGWSELLRLDAAGLGTLGTCAAETLLLNLSVATIFPQVAAKVAAAPQNCGIGVARRARDYIAAHASEAIDIAQLAVLLGISMRTLQDNFRRQFGCSPRDFVLRCRLERARDVLLTQGETTTVTDAATSCGFSDLGYFSAKYRERYGELPSATLRRMRV